MTARDRPDVARRPARDPRGDAHDELPRHAGHQRRRAGRDHRHRQPRRRRADDPSEVVVAGPDAAARVGADRAAGRRRRRSTLDVTTAPDDDAAVAAVDDGDADVAVSADGTRLTTDGAGRPVGRLVAGDGRQRAARRPRPRQRAAGRRARPRAGRRGPGHARRPTSTPCAPSDADEVDSSRLATATITNILLFIMLQTYGQWVLTGVTREKASRVVEVLLAVITPRQLLIGKVLGIGIVALAHAAVLIVVALVTTRIMGVDLTDGIALGDLALAGAVVRARLRPLLQRLRRRRLAGVDGSRTPRAWPSRSCCRCCSATSCRSPPPAGPARCCGCWRSSRRPRSWRCRRCTRSARRRCGRSASSMALTVVAIVAVAALAAADLRALGAAHAAASCRGGRRSAAPASSTSTIGAVTAD